MKKTVVILFAALNSFFAFSQTEVNIGPEQKIKAEMKVPAAIKPGSEFTVEIKITKGSVSGLGRFQQYLPKGMTAAPLENAGADFSFENQNVKFIWLNLPQTEIINIKYKVTTDVSINNTKTLSGTFSYVENGRTKSFSLVPKEVRIDPKATAEEIVATNTQPEPTPVQTESSSATAEPKTEIIPPLPTETKAEIATTPAETKPVDEKIIAQQSVEIPQQKPAVEETPASSTATKKGLDNVTEKREPVASSVSSGAENKAGIIFRVQIAAMNEKHFRKDGHFQKKFGIVQTVFTEEHDGLKKYSVGNFSTYNEARTLRDEISSNANGSFVIAYKDGVRISVSEALSLLKQK